MTKLLTSKSYFVLGPRPNDPHGLIHIGHDMTRSGQTHFQKRCHAINSPCHDKTRRDQTYILLEAMPSSFLITTSYVVTNKKPCLQLYLSRLQMSSPAISPGLYITLHDTMCHDLLRLESPWLHFLLGHHKLQPTLIDPNELKAPLSSSQHPML